MHNLMSTSIIANLWNSIAVGKRLAKTDKKHGSLK